MSNLINNKKIHFDYEIIEKFKAGIELLGFEVKSIKNNRGNIENAHITARGNEVFLLNADIPPYQPDNSPKNYDPKRNRRLLLTKKEIKKLGEEEKKPGLTIVPICMYNSKRKIKLEIAIVRGKKKFDKRETIKKKDAQRDTEREIKKRF